MAGRRGPGLVGRAVTALLLAASLSVVCVGEVPRPPGCALARGELTVDDLPAGSSVLDCLAVGRVVTHEGAGVAVPEPGTTVSVDALTVDGSAHGFTLTVAADGSVSYVYEEAHEAAHEGPDGATRAAPRAAAAASRARADAPAPCADGAYSTAGRKEYDTYEWFIGDGPPPGRLSHAEGRMGLRGRHRHHHHQPQRLRLRRHGHGQGQVPVEHRQRGRHRRRGPLHPPGRSERVGRGRHRRRGRRDDLLLEPSRARRTRGTARGRRPLQHP